MNYDINTVEGLVAELRSVPAGSGQLEVLQHMKVPVAELERRMTWHPRHYTRTCLVRDRYFELLLIGFEPGQQTSIHDYNGHEAWVHPLQGELTEERFAADMDGKLRLVSSVVLGPRCLSLNLYCGPIRKWKVYDAHSGRSTTIGTPAP